MPRLTFHLLHLPPELIKNKSIGKNSLATGQTASTAKKES